MAVHSLTAHELRSMIDAGDAIVIDVREPAEFASGHLASARNLPLGEICHRGIASDQGKLVIHCKAGRRGLAACAKLEAEQSGRELYHLEGGLDAWQAAGFPITVATRRVLPLDRQVQLAIGVVLLTASVGGYVADFLPLFVLTGLVGLGLSVAGVTGFCGLARLLALAPWNQRG